MQYLKNSLYNLKETITASILINCYFIFGTGLAFSIVLPSLFDFVTKQPNEIPPGLGQSDTFYSFVIAVSSFSELFIILVLGFVAEKFKLKILFTISSIVGLVGYILYCFTVDGTMLIISRILTGFWAGAQNVLVRIWVNSSISKEHIPQVLNYVGIAGCLSSAIGPYIGASFSDVYYRFGPFEFSTFSAPGYILVFFSATSIPLLYFLQTPEIEKSIDESTKLLSAKPVINEEKPTPKKNRFWTTNGHSNFVIIVILITFFCASIGFTLVESIATPIVEYALNFSVKQTGTLFLIGGICNFVMFIFQTVCLNQKWLTPKTLNLISLLISIFGVLIMSDMYFISVDNYATSQYCTSIKDTQTCQQILSCYWNENVDKCLSYTSYVNMYQFYIGFSFIQVAFPLGRVGSSSVFTQLLGQNKNSLMQSLLVSSGCLAKIIGPFVGIALLTVVSYHTFLLMAVLFVVYFVITLLFICIFRKID